MAGRTGARPPQRSSAERVAHHETGWDAPPFFLMSDRAQTVLHNLSAAFLAGEWTKEGLLERGGQACGRRENWLRSLVNRLLAAFAEPPPQGDAAPLVHFLKTDRVFQKVLCILAAQDPPYRRLFWVPERMLPRSGPPASWPLPVITSPGQLAEWLGLTPAELDWFADPRGRGRFAEPGPLRHYVYRWVAGRRGKIRLLEIPKSRLKSIQRVLLHKLLDLVPAHDAAHGFRRGRSVATYVAPHCGKQIVLHMDLCDFFSSVRASRAHALFRTAGYPASVARLLTGLCTNRVPDDALDAAPRENARPLTLDQRQRLRSPHLPQGAPTSPALASLCAYRLDCRLFRLAEAVGGHYTRYADDLVFSGGEELARSVRRFHILVCTAVLEEGFEVNTRKSHFMRPGVRQQVAGIVLNERPNVVRREFDRLKAVLTNCLRHGPRGQNRGGHVDFRSHLAGRIAYVGMLNPTRGQRLRELFDRIVWEDGAGGRVQS